MRLNCDLSLESENWAVHIGVSTRRIPDSKLETHFQRPLDRHIQNAERVYMVDAG